MLGYPRYRDADPDDTVNSYRNDVADWWMFRALPAAAGVLLLWWLAGCSGGGIDFDGGWHDLLERGIDVQIYSVPTVVKPEIHPPREVKIGPPWPL